MDIDKLKNCDNCHNDGVFGIQDLKEECMFCTRNKIHENNPDWYKARLSFIPEEIKKDIINKMKTRNDNWRIKE